MVTELKLLPCPFCRCETIRRFHPFEQSGYVIDCNRCNGGFHNVPEDQAVARWNTRAAIEATRPTAATDDVVKELVEALAEAREALALAADIPLIDPRHSEAIADLCDRVGYGAVMSSASAQWRAKLSDLAGGEFCAGPCRGTAEKAIETIDAALARTGVTLNG